MIGKERLAVGSWQLAEEEARGKAERSSLLPTANCLLPTSSRGFTLLELMIVISILVILAVIAMPQYQKSVVHARETVLRDDLFHLRKAIDMYGADKGKLPQTLEDLVNAGYIREIPIDPMTGERDWTIVTGEDPSSLSGEQGIRDIHSASGDTSTEDTAYSEW